MRRLALLVAAVCVATLAAVPVASATVEDEEAPRELPAEYELAT